MNAHAYAQAYAARFVAQLKDLLRIPSVSTDPERQADMRRAAEWLAEDMRRIGLARVEILPTAGHPAVYGEWLQAGPDQPTALIYGHYDVQPAEREAGWISDPFEPVERDGLLYARGASDDKGQMFAHLKAAEALLAAGGAPVNLKFLIEGEEEIGSPHLAALVAAERERLRADFCVISDTGMRKASQPTLIYALRGLMYMEVEVFGPAKDLHSGLGGTVHNPALALAQLIARLHTPDGRVAVPGFYDDVQALSEAERARLNQTALTPEEWAQILHTDRFWGEPGYALHERYGARPTLEINGLVSGFTGAGSKTVLPARALAKISCRLVPEQNPRRVYEQVSGYIQAITPPTVRVETRLLAEAFPAVTDLNAPVMTAAARAFEMGWGAAPSFERGGGTLPILVDFQRELGGLPVILMGFGLITDGAHGPNEHFSLEMFHKGIASAIHLYQQAARR